MQTIITLASHNDLGAYETPEILIAGCSWCGEHVRVAVMPQDGGGYFKLCAPCAANITADLVNDDSEEV